MSDPDHLVIVCLLPLGHLPPTIVAVKTNYYSGAAADAYIRATVGVGTGFLEVGLCVGTRSRRGRCMRAAAARMRVERELYTEGGGVPGRLSSPIGPIRDLGMVLIKYTRVLFVRD